MTSDIPRFYVGRYFSKHAVYDVLINNSPALSVHDTQDQAQQAADARNTPKRPARAAAQTALFDEQEVSA